MSLVWEGYFADPFVLQLPNGHYLAYGTQPPDATTAGEPRVFECLQSSDLIHWSSVGAVLDRLPAAAGDDYWAPEIAHIDGSWWLYYSVGHGIDGHHLRVARADAPTGPFRDMGINLTPNERFAIDAHPFQAPDGTWYLYFARDVLDHPRPGSHIAVAPLNGPTRIGTARTALAPFADWQIYRYNRNMYQRQYTWHTIEGPSVVYRQGAYWMTYSGGAWTGSGYAVSWAKAPHPLGPWMPAPDVAAPLLATDGDLIGPGHNSLTVAPSGEDAIVFHAWDSSCTKRMMHVATITFDATHPVVHPLTHCVSERSQHFPHS